MRSKEKGCLSLKKPVLFGVGVRKITKVFAFKVQNNSSLYVVFYLNHYKVSC